MKLRFIIWILFFTSAGILLINACKKSDGGSRHTPTALSFITPPGFPPPFYLFENNPLTREGFELGRKLFYDGRLSQDGNFPCSSCHQQFAAFSTFDHDLSHGFNNQFTTRNAPGLFNLAWQHELHWDGGINHIEVLNHYSEEVVQSPTLDPLLVNGIPLTNVEKFYLQEFLYTLTDSSFINDKRFSAPE